MADEDAAPDYAALVAENAQLFALVGQLQAAIVLRDGEIRSLREAAAHVQQEPVRVLDPGAKDMFDRPFMGHGARR